MPIPFLLAGAAVLGAAVGAKKMHDAHSDNKDAQYTNRRAREIVDEAKEELNERRELTSKALARLGETKVEVLQNNVSDFIDLFGRIRNIKLGDSVGLEELQNLRFEAEDMNALKEMNSVVLATFQGGVSGVGLGALAAFGAYNGAMAFGAASTGTAIATLSGAAATNATLAFLGGGSLAAGGLGIAGGTAVLGGIVAAPILVVMGFSMSSKAKANKEKAYSNYAEAKKFSEEVDNIVTVCNAIKNRAYMFTDLLRKLKDDAFAPSLEMLKQVIDSSGTDFDCYGQREKEIVGINLAIAKAVKTIIDTPILTQDGALTDESEKLLPDAKKDVDELQAKAETLMIYG